MGYWSYTDYRDTFTHHMSYRASELAGGASLAAERTSERSGWALKGAGRTSEKSGKAFERVVRPLIQVLH